MIAGLVKRGLATLTRETIRVGSRLVDVGKVRITAAGREALTTEGLAFYPAGVAFSCLSAPISTWTLTGTGTGGTELVERPSQAHGRISP
jgi:hypothetical protein